MFAFSQLLFFGSDLYTNRFQISEIVYLKFHLITSICGFI